LISSGIDLGDAKSELRGDECRRERRVDIAVDDRPVGAMLEQDGLEALHHPRGLDRVGR
jgi:hypothetical protein